MTTARNLARRDGNVRIATDTINLNTGSASPMITSQCRFETTFENKARRFPFYTTDKSLPIDPKLLVMDRLDHVQDTKITQELLELQERLLPGPHEGDKKEKLLKKLESLLSKRWPDKCFTVHAFGSTENLLGTRTSDLDVCIETDWAELETQICILSHFMYDAGMLNVECRSRAKVPVVSIFDPELNVTCDMNVNNTLALRNTRLVRTYMQVDDRAQALTCVVKHWAKMRALNDALCNTLTSYSWTLLVINFLQTRCPPVLPCLHTWPHEPTPFVKDVDVSFADDIEKYGLSMFDAGNTESVASLLFGFYHYYTYVFDYEHDVVSVRHGRAIPKYLKCYSIDNIVAIEEPFTTSRNLGNTADTSSFRGIHEELQRAHTLLATGHQLSSVCEQYESRKVRRNKHPVGNRAENKSRTLKLRQARVAAATISSSGLYQPNLIHAESRSQSAAQCSTVDVLSSKPGIDLQTYHMAHGCVAEHLQYLRPATHTSGTQALGKAIPGSPRLCYVNQHIETLDLEDATSKADVNQDGQYIQHNINKARAMHHRVQSQQDSPVVVEVCQIDEYDNSINTRDQAESGNKPEQRRASAIPPSSALQGAADVVPLSQPSNLLAYSASEVEESQSSGSLVFASSRSSPVSITGLPMDDQMASWGFLQGEQSKYPVSYACRIPKVLTKKIKASNDLDKPGRMSETDETEGRPKITYASKVSNIPCIEPDLL